MERRWYPTRTGAVRGLQRTFHNEILGATALVPKSAIRRPLTWSWKVYCCLSDACCRRHLSKNQMRRTMQGSTLRQGRALPWALFGHRSTGAASSSNIRTIPQSRTTSILLRSKYMLLCKNTTYFRTLDLTYNLFY